MNGVPVESPDDSSGNFVQVPFPLVAALVQYLATRPYMEVHELIAGLQAANAQKPDDGGPAD